MKKRTKITLRTKIYLTIVGLLSLTGVFYAQFPPSHPTPFVFTVPFPTSAAAARDLLLVSEYCSENIRKVDCNGFATLFATLPGFGSCQEKYMAIAPSQSGPPNNTFTPRDVFVTEGPNVYKITGGIVTLFAGPIGGCLSSDHNGITFDHFGTFGFDMIVTCQEGSVFRVNGSGVATQIAFPFQFPPGAEIKSPAAVPIGFGPQGGKIWVADEANDAVHAISSAGIVTQNIISHFNTEGVFVIPNPPC